MHSSPLHFLTCRGEAKVQVSSFLCSLTSNDSCRRLNRSYLGKKDKESFQLVCRYTQNPHALLQAHRPKNPRRWESGLWCKSACGVEEILFIYGCFFAQLNAASVDPPRRTSRRNVRTRIWWSCRPWSMLTLSTGRRRRRSWSPSRRGL